MHPRGTILQPSVNSVYMNDVRVLPEGSVTDRSSAPTAQRLPLVQTCICLYGGVSIGLVKVAEVHPCEGFPAKNHDPIELDTAGQVRQAQQVREREVEDERSEVKSHKMLTVLIELETVERENSSIRSCCPASSPMQGLETTMTSFNDTVAVRRIARKRRFPGSSDDDVAHARKRRRYN